MTTDKISSVVRHLWKSMLALGAVALIVGVAVLIWPGESIVVAAALFGGYLLASGIAQVVGAFTVYTSAASRVLLFISGALSIGLGVVAFRDFNDGAAVWLLTRGSASDSSSKVSPRRCWRSASRSCPTVAGTSS